jgi:hypothetical protein
LAIYGGRREEGKNKKSAFYREGLLLVGFASIRALGCSHGMAMHSNRRSVYDIFLRGL